MAIEYILTNQTREHVMTHFSSDLPGSYFDTSVFPTPESIFSFLKNKAIYECIKQENGSEIHIYKFEHEIGFDGIGTYNEMQDESVFKLERNGIEIPYVITHNSLPKTTQLCLVVFISNENYQVITMFPGKYAPPFPNNKQSTTFYKTCKEFWEEHILMKENY